MIKKAFLSRKHVLSILSLIGLLISLCGCSEPIKFVATPPAETSRETEIDYNLNSPSEKYTVKEINGQHYIFIEDVEYYKNIETDWKFMSEFPSVEDFITRITTGKPLVFNAYIDIAQNFEKDDVGIKICDPYNIYTPILPNNMKVTSFHWEGQYYLYPINNFDASDYLAEGLTGYFRFCSKEKLEEEYLYRIKNYSSDECIVKSLNNEEKEVDAIFTENGIRAYFYEEENELYYELFLYYDCANLRQHTHKLEEWYPSDEWLLSFGVEKYVEEPNQ